jgi:hypothetical protein
MNTNTIKSTLVCFAILASIAIVNGQDYSFEKIPLTDTNIAKITNVVSVAGGGDPDDWEASVKGAKVNLEGSSIGINGSLNTTIDTPVLKITNNIISGTNITCSGEKSFAGGSGSSVNSKNSMAFGEDSFVGLKGWYYCAVDFNTGTFYLSATQPTTNKTPIVNITEEGFDDSAIYNSTFVSGY